MDSAFNSVANGPGSSSSPRGHCVTTNNLVSCAALIKVVIWKTLKFMLCNSYFF